MHLLNWLICAAMNVPCPSPLGVDVAVVPADGLLDPVRAHLPERGPSFVWALDPGRRSGRRRKKTPGTNRADR
jgi:hypothetical protein